MSAQDISVLRPDRQTGGTNCQLVPPKVLPHIALSAGLLSVVVACVNAGTFREHLLIVMLLMRPLATPPHLVFSHPAD